MRFKLILEVNRKAFGNLLPLNYQYEQSAAIYKILASASEEYAKWLHDNGYMLGRGKRFKLFTFSPFKIEKRKVLFNEERIAILCDMIEWQISFFPEQSTEKFIQGIFVNQVFEIGDKSSTVQFHVRSVEVLPSPLYKDEMKFATMSPMCLRCNYEDGKIEYLSPIDIRAKNAIRAGLLSRYEAFYGNPFDEENFNFDFILLDEPKSKLIKIKANTQEETKVRGFMCQFKMEAPIAMMKMMYEGGIGEECAVGFGCLREKCV